MIYTYICNFFPKMFSYVFICKVVELNTSYIFDTYALLQELSHPSPIRSSWNVRPILAGIPARAALHNSIDRSRSRLFPKTVVPVVCLKKLSRDQTKKDLRLPQIQ